MLEKGTNEEYSDNNAQDAKTIEPPQSDYRLDRDEAYGTNQQQLTNQNFFPRKTFQGSTGNRELGMKKYAQMRPEWNERFHINQYQPSATVRLGNSQHQNSYQQPNQLSNSPFRSKPGILLVPK